MSLFRHLFARKAVPPIKWSPVHLPRVFPDDYPVCRDELLPSMYSGCAFEWEGRCLSSLPCKYKGLCADAPITEQEV